MTILFTFALGTAGDYIAETLNLGYWKSALLFEGCIGVARAYRFAKLNAIPAFWIAYILTRPLGASISGYLSSAQHEGGLALGTVGTSAPLPRHDPHVGHLPHRDPEGLGRRQGTDRPLAGGQKAELRRPVGVLVCF